MADGPAIDDQRMLRKAAAKFAPGRPASKTAMSAAVMGSDGDPNDYEPIAANQVDDEEDSEDEGYDD